MKYPAMTVLTGNMIKWTCESEKAIIAGKQSLPEYKKILDEQLKEIVKLVRGELTSLIRLTFESLVFIYIF
jgi:lipopolysaccharide export system protein LptC